MKFLTYVPHSKVHAEIGRPNAFSFDSPSMGYAGGGQGAN